MTINISVDGIEVDHLALFQQQCRALYDFLRSDKDESVRRHSAFCMGPLSSEGASWFACLGDGRVKYHDLPRALTLEMQLKDQKPMQVTMGRNGSYVAIWPNDEFLTWDLRGYPGLHEMLDETKPEDVNTVVLNPYNDSDWFLVMEDGHVFWHLSNDKVTLRKIAAMARAYMQRQARRRNKTYYTCGTDGELVISPDTNYDKEDRQVDESAWERLLGRLGIRNHRPDRPATDFSHFAPSRVLRLPKTLSERKYQIATGLGVGVVAVSAAAWASPSFRQAALARLRVRMCPHYYTSIASTAMFFCTCYALGYWRGRAMVAQKETGH
ncbi:hypothetical protein HII31_06183 [Pseudocercospora fuligena]|uniref:Uncharacterized protein n=1 Tax=Pseudocercospora fuligena TaxID=685502 RepID=A0A8H6RHA3_9PEZI|nr:hypothetical protein HII31_06183 [Pseudocercospora fuligena]